MGFLEAKYQQSRLPCSQCSAAVLVCMAFVLARVGHEGTMHWQMAHCCSEGAVEVAGWPRLRAVHGRCLIPALLAARRAGLRHLRAHG